MSTDTSLMLFYGEEFVDLDTQCCEICLEPLSDHNMLWLDAYGFVVACVRWDDA